MLVTPPLCAFTISHLSGDIGLLVIVNALMNPSFQPETTVLSSSRATEHPLTLFIELGLHRVMTCRSLRSHTKTKPSISIVTNILLDTLDTSRPTTDYRWPSQWTVQSSELVISLKILPKLLPTINSLPVGSTAIEVSLPSNYTSLSSAHLESLPTSFLTLPSPLTTNRERPLMRIFCTPLLEMGTAALKMPP